MKRRDFLWFTGIATGSVSMPALLSGCAVDPITGEATFSLVSQEQEIEMDRQQSPHQFSADYGSNSDSALNNYVSQIGRAIAENSHRAHMPYNYRVVDANHVNAYTFPGGSMAITRGIMVEMQSESELAGLLGHEIGHVNARHASERVTKSMLAQAAVGLASSTVKSGDLQKVVSGLGTLSATALLAKYSRDNEREADRLGMDYSVGAGANPQGMVDLMNLLNGLHKSAPGALEIMYSSHPMSQERLDNAKYQLTRNYNAAINRDAGRERYMDYTYSLRQQKTLIKALAQADMAISAGEISIAKDQLDIAKSMDHDDYATWVISAKLQMSDGNSVAAIADLDRASQLKPREYLTLYMKGANYLEMSQPDRALASFQRYKEHLPGNPMTDFFIGYSFEQMDQKNSAAEAYLLFLGQVNQGAQAEHAYTKLKLWGYVS